MAKTLTEKIISAHLVTRDADWLAVKPAQVLLQDATGTLVMQALESIGLNRVKVPLAVQYVDHNLIQSDFRNADDHAYLRSAAAAFGIWFAEPGEGVSHPVHAMHFGVPGALLLGSDSHTCAAGALGMIGIGAGSFDVAATLAGRPYALPAPRVRRITLTGTPPPMVGAKDVILTLLGRHGVAGARGMVLEYDGPGVAAFGVMDRMAIANMGAELGATASVFPSDERTHAFLEHAGRGNDWAPLTADPGARYDDEDELDLSLLEPMIARPGSPANVVPVREVQGTPVGQAYIGSSASPGYADIARVAAMLNGRRKADGVSLDLNPATRNALLGLMASGALAELVASGARLHQVGCNGCNGMGQAPGSTVNSLRTVPRNFPGRSGSVDDRVWLCGPETAAAAALTGQITDPRSVSGTRTEVPEFPPVTPKSRIVAPGKHALIVRGPNIAHLPRLEPLSGPRTLPILMAVGDNISTDDISPAGVDALPLRSNPERLAEHTFRRMDPDYVARARSASAGHAIIAGRNFGQGSSREHATLCPRLLGLEVVLAVGYARIFHANLVNVGILPLWIDEADLDTCRKAKALTVNFDQVTKHHEMTVQVDGSGISAHHRLSSDQRNILAAGGLLNSLVEGRENMRAQAR